MARSNKKKMIGMIHLRPLPGAPRFKGDIEPVIQSALLDATTLQHCGFDMLCLENFGDAPFFPGRVGPETVAFMTRIVAEVTQAVPLPIGINVLRNDAISALAIAAATQATFIRVNVHSEVRLTDQGIIQGTAHETLRYRQLIGASSIQIFADIHCKHSKPLAESSLSYEAENAVLRGMADAIIVTGEKTSAPPDPKDLKELSKNISAPIYLGSGATADNIRKYWDYIDGVIIGTGIKKDRHPANPIDEGLAQEFMARVKELA